MAAASTKPTESTHSASAGVNARRSGVPATSGPASGPWTEKGAKRAEGRPPIVLGKARPRGRVGGRYARDALCPRLPFGDAALASRLDLRPVWAGREHTVQKLSELAAARAAIGQAKAVVGRVRTDERGDTRIAGVAGDAVRDIGSDIGETAATRARCAPVQHVGASVGEVRHNRRRARDRPTRWARPREYHLRLAVDLYPLARTEGGQTTTRQAQAFARSERRTVFRRGGESGWTAAPRSSFVTRSSTPMVAARSRGATRRSTLRTACSTVPGADGTFNRAPALVTRRWTRRPSDAC